MNRINTKIIKFFSCLADPTRLKIVQELMKKPLIVGEIHKALGCDNLTISAVSHQLKTMSDCDIIYHEKNGREKTFHLSKHFCWCMVKDAENHFSGNSECKACAKWLK